MILFRLKPAVSRTALAISVTSSLLSILASASGHMFVSALLVFCALTAAVKATIACGRIAAFTEASITSLNPASPVQKVLEQRPVEVGASLRKTGVDAA